MKRSALFLMPSVFVCIPVLALADETLVTSVDLPGASMTQEVTYSPSKAAYEEARESILKRLREGDKTALINPQTGPWMRVETTATIGIEIRGAGFTEGRKHLRQISAADEALYKFEHSK